MICDDECNEQRRDCERSHGGQDKNEEDGGDLLELWPCAPNRRGSYVERVRTMDDDRDEVVMGDESYVAHPKSSDRQDRQHKDASGVDADATKADVEPAVEEVQSVGEMAEISVRSSSSPNGARNMEDQSVKEEEKDHAFVLVAQEGEGKIAAQQCPVENYEYVDASLKNEVDDESEVLYEDGMLELWPCDPEKRGSFVRCQQSIDHHEDGRDVVVKNTTAKKSTEPVVDTLDGNGCPEGDANYDESADVDDNAKHGNAEINSMMRDSSAKRIIASNTNNYVTSSVGTDHNPPTMPSNSAHRSSANSGEIFEGKMRSGRPRRATMDFGYTRPSTTSSFERNNNNNGTADVDVKRSSSPTAGEESPKSGKTEGRKWFPRRRVTMDMGYTPPPPSTASSSSVDMSHVAASRWEQYESTNRSWRSQAVAELEGEVAVAAMQASKTVKKKVGFSGNTDSSEKDKKSEADDIDALPSIFQMSLMNLHQSFSHPLQKDALQREEKSCEQASRRSIEAGAKSTNEKKNTSAESRERDAVFGEGDCVNHRKYGSGGKEPIANENVTMIDKSARPQKQVRRNSMFGRVPQQSLNPGHDGSNNGDEESRAMPSSGAAVERSPNDGSSFVPGNDNDSDDTSVASDDSHDDDILAAEAWMKADEAFMAEAWDLMKLKEKQMRALGLDSPFSDAAEVFPYFTSIHTILGECMAVQGVEACQEEEHNDFSHDHDGGHEVSVDYSHNQKMTRFDETGCASCSDVAALNIDTSDDVLGAYLAADDNRCINDDQNMSTVAVHSDSSTAQIHPESDTATKGEVTANVEQGVEPQVVCTQSNIGTITFMTKYMYCDKELSPPSGNTYTVCAVNAGTFLPPTSLHEIKSEPADGNCSEDAIPPTWRGNIWANDRNRNGWLVNGRRLDPAADRQISLHDRSRNGGFSGALRLLKRASM